MPLPPLLERLATIFLREIISALSLACLCFAFAAAAALFAAFFAAAAALFAAFFAAALFAFFMALNTGAKILGTIFLVRLIDP
jgi:hypothetical protein